MVFKIQRHRRGGPLCPLVKETLEQTGKLGGLPLQKPEYRKITKKQQNNKNSNKKRKRFQWSERKSRFNNLEII